MTIVSQSDSQVRFRDADMPLGAVPDVKIYESVWLVLILSILFIFVAWPLAIVLHAIVLVLALPLAIVFMVTQKMGLSDTLIFLVLVVVTIPLTLISPPFLLLWGLISGAIIRDTKAEEAEKERLKEEMILELFESKFQRVADSCTDSIDDCRKKDLIYAREKIKTATSEYGDNCPGEAKYLLSCAAKIVKPHGKFGACLEDLLLTTIGNVNVFDVDGKRSEVHRMMWQCARTITIQLEKASSSQVLIVSKPQPTGSESAFT